MRARPFVAGGLNPGRRRAKPAVTPSIGRLRPAGGVWANPIGTALARSRALALAGQRPARTALAGHLLTKPLAGAGKCLILLEAATPGIEPG
jgi:hypothetical protein